MPLKRFFAAALICVLFSVGCNRESKKIPDPSPRPVSVVELNSFEPSAPELVSGVVGSWKTEQIGFEVEGRVTYVIEPEQMVDGYLTTRSESVENIGRVAEIDPNRYQTQLDGAKSQVEVLKLELEAQEVQVEDEPAQGDQPAVVGVLPAKIASAEAAYQLATIEYERTEGLLARKAVPQAKFDEVEAAWKQADAEVKQAKANLKAKHAEIESLKSQIKVAQAVVVDAEQNVRDCKLKAPFKGQIAEVHVIPGAFVRRGEPVVTLQMMNPIKIEFEVSAERARQFRYKDEIGITLYTPDGTELKDKEGIIYQTGTVADAGTRTFTITVLMENDMISTLKKEAQQKKESEEKQDQDDEASKRPAFTNDVWKLIDRVIGDGKSYYFEKTGIHQDDQGHFLYRISSPTGRQLLGKTHQVERVPIVAEKEEISFLGLWTFQRVTFPPNSDINPEDDRFVGELGYPDDDPANWDQTSVLFERVRWLLRPGDLIRLDLSQGQGGFGAGFYAPLGAIQESDGKFYVFVLQDDGTVKRVEIKWSDGPNTLRRITPVAAGELKEKDRIVSGGAHYLVDGEKVKVVGTN